MTVPPAELLALSRALIDRAEPTTAGLWPRAAALLARQALECTVAELWRSKVPAVADCSLRAQFLALSSALPDPAMAGRAMHAWTSLSRACHHHVYELAPSEMELRVWMDEVDAVIAACAPTKRRGGTGS